jgi:hypothetical protein
MGRNKKLTKAVRERMARTGENYTEARTKLLAEQPPEWFRLDRVEDVEIGNGDRAELNRTLHVRYVVRDPDGSPVAERDKVFALDETYTGWMRALVGQRVGGLRRIEGEWRSAAIPREGGRCVIEARLVAVKPIVPEPPQELVRGSGRPAAYGDRVRVRFRIGIRAPAPAGAAMPLPGPAIASSGDAGLWVFVGAGEIEPGVDRVIVGMRAGGSRSAVLPADGEVPERWLLLDLLEIGG